MAETGHFSILLPRWQRGDFLDVEETFAGQWRNASLDDGPHRFFIRLFGPWAEVKPNCVIWPRHAHWQSRWCVEMADGTRHSKSHCRCWQSLRSCVHEFSRGERKPEVLLCRISRRTQPTI